MVIPAILMRWSLRKKLRILSPPLFRPLMKQKVEIGCWSAVVDANNTCDFSNIRFQIGNSFSSSIFTLPKWWYFSFERVIHSVPAHRYHIVIMKMETEIDFPDFPSNWFRFTVFLTYPACRFPVKQICMYDAEIEMTKKKHQLSSI